MRRIQYTIRNIPETTDKALRRRAQKQHKSFNQTVVEALEKAAGNTKKPTRYRDLDWFIGSGKNLRTSDRKAEEDAQAWLDSLPSDLGDNVD